MSINDLSVGRSVEETLRLVKAFQFVEKHGELCPANWTENSPTIKPNPRDSQEYFEKVNQWNDFMEAGPKSPSFEKCPEKSPKYTITKMKHPAERKPSSIKERKFTQLL